MSGDAEHLAALHASAYDSPWDDAAFADLLTAPGVLAVVEPDGFILIRAAADEAEILTLAVRPEARGRGLAGILLRQALADAATRDVRRVFLEVADDNLAARAVYAKAGFEQAGIRPRYYARPDGSRRDALLLALNLPDPLP
ncbi:ribosomal protein S18-alanine N-acetyltransferase [Brevundimonas sp. NPDC092305]|uniref:ribosomal protein S18-alanine N-acetyltransferase n=1 Tax=Brevundimonas sp. NPDC092305 TaxID=3363957 RepID=UPI0038234D05